MDAVRLDRVGALWLVGCGNMGSALLARWLACGLDRDKVTVIDPRGAGAFPAVKTVKAVGDAVGQPDVVLLAVKPQMLGAVSNELRTRAGDALLISILAGVETEVLRTISPRVVRAMPNTPARIGAGATVLFGDEGADRAIAHAMMAAVGAVHWIEQEALFDAVTAVSGSGPAYLFCFIEALAQAGATAGLPPGLAAALALQTVTGSAALAGLGQATPGQLRAEVTSPNGTTAAGLAMLDGEGALTALIEKTVAAAAARSRELASVATPAAPGSSAGRPAG